MSDQEGKEEREGREKAASGREDIRPEETLDDEAVKTTRYPRTVSPSWIPGVVQVQLHDWVRPDLLLSTDGEPLGLKRRYPDRPLRRINRLLERKGLQRVEATFQGMTQLTADARQEVARQQGIIVPNLCSFFTLYFPEDADVKRIARQLNKLKIVVQATTVPQTMPSQANPEDPLLGVDDIVVTPIGELQNQWYIFRCLINKAWEHATERGRNVVIIDIDWGYRTTHVDLKDRLDPVHRFNATDESKCVSQGDMIRHGTGVMGIAGAAANTHGIVGVASNAELWPVQLNAAQNRHPDMWTRAFQWAMDENSGGKRKVIILEGQTKEESNIESLPAVRVAVETAIAMGIVVCVAAGNGNKDAGVDDERKPFPPTGSILIGSTRHRPDRVNQRSRNSNWGKTVTVAAPGDRLNDVTCSHLGDEEYTNVFGGTSGAAPKVAGTVALMLEKNRYMRHSDIRDILNREGSSVITPTAKPVGRFLNSHAAVLAAQFAPAWGTCWETLPEGKAVDIEFGSDSNSFWRVGDDHRINRLNGNKWVEDEALCDGAPCSALKVAVEADGTLWHISATDKRIYRKVNGAWQQVPGPALDIASGADGSVWRVGTDHAIYRWDGNQWQLFDSPSPAIKIAVDPEGRPWYIARDTNYIFKWARNLWQQAPGQALDIAIGDDGSVWHIGVNEPGEEGRMRRWNGFTWEPIDGTATVITVAPNGLPVHINNARDILART
ncbi:MAG TPA: S8 family serine peptidase [Pyrinomonadaceae bacterium]|jgi:subtilisin family serine protease